MPATYQQLLGPLFGRSAMGMRLGLHVTTRLLAALGAPDKAFSHVIVAGTNGKGSTSALLADALRRSGLQVGLFTSPHLCSYTERIRVNGVAIGQQDVVRLVNKLAQAEQQTGLSASFFEATTLLACLYFCERNVEVAVMECGLGGRLDATNALDDGQRIASMITPIDLDHQHILGEDRVTIAQEKAAIMRARVPVVVAPQHDDVLLCLREHAQRSMAPIIETLAAASPANSATLHGYLDVNRLVAQTAFTALAATTLAGRLQAQAFNQAVQHFVWPGRYHKVPARRAGGPSYLIDGSHNPAGMEALCRSLTADSALANKRLHALFAVMPHKDGAALKAMLLPHVASLHRCRLAINAAAVADDRPTAAHMLAQLDGALGPGDVVLVVGSLYLAGEALSHLCGWPQDPPVHG